jgi:transcriptional regulator with XRE-family HTH domain
MTDYERYCKIRDSRGFKDADIVKKTGITKSTFSSWKSGVYTPKEGKIQKIAEALGVTADYIRYGEDVQDNNVNFEANNTLDTSNDAYTKLLESISEYSDLKRRRGKYLKEYLNYIGMDEYILAEKMNSCYYKPIKASSIEYWEKGRSLPERDRLKLLFDILGPEFENGWNEIKTYEVEEGELLCDLLREFNKANYKNRKLILDILEISAPEWFICNETPVRIQVF